MGINLNEEQVTVLHKYFDKDGSGQVDLNEFMVAIRVSIKSNKFFIILMYVFLLIGPNEQSKNVMGKRSIR